MKNISDFEKFKLTDSRLIFGGEGDGGTIEKKKLKIPSNGVIEEEEEEEEEDN